MASTQFSDGCIFCKIASGKDASTVILFENERICIFKDIRPAADNHLLAIPKHHIGDVRPLTVSDKPLLEEMRTELSNVLKDQFQVDDTTVLFGFHIPPFTTVKHLHMHGIAPVSSMGFISRMMFKPESMWFKTATTIIDRLPPTPVT
ncbi:adenosine 5'-monophosphoramidase HINT3-like isoform X2 [Topomyia yanbarensis]|uniref:adenosine 5'-monophosphoramidase HINT3-like isoform X2 n=1 Tax=Topomyia yanbarensis TaxID=2498891 RepID=UPI00273B8036|nr:adenosine 5'-monophosphoramidase HINT3-like isoform X2 [Topomyia yanbarensis]